MKLFQLYILAATMLFTSCESFVDIGKAPNQLLIEDAYKADATATSAVLNIYGGDQTIYHLGYSTFLGGVESDELVYATNTDIGITEFYQATVSINNVVLQNYLWTYPYAVINKANVAIAGLNASTTLTPAVKDQLLGECKFFRALVYFNLVNYFGAVPMPLSGDALKDAFLPRTFTDSIWTQVITDLKEAEAQLPAAYVVTSRARVNKYSATALLARAYLYTRKYPEAEAAATRVIGATDITYSLPAPAAAFKNTSNEVILQIATTTSLNSFPFTGTFYASNVQYVLSPSFRAAFETGDLRKTAWTRDSIITKYKMTAGDEYNVVLRLAEQYLIRAEARAQQENINGAQQDLDAVRGRAGLGNTTATDKTTLLAAIAQERKVELFGEAGHRWFDLKRTEKADDVLKTLKTGWVSTAVLAPIPFAERIKNKALTQNNGYN